MPLRHRAHKMCEYQADATAELDEEMLLYRLRELVQPKHVRTEERVVMGTHDFPLLEVSKPNNLSDNIVTRRMLITCLLIHSLPS